MKSKFLIICSFLLFSSFAWSQSKVTGVVSDNEGNPLPLVNILVKGTQEGVLTDFDGAYTINVSPGDQLQFSFLGFEKQVITYNGDKNINVVLKSTTSALEEVVVVGYNTQKKGDIVGSIANVSGVDLRKSGMTNVTHMIQDALPGVMTEITSGQPGADNANISIRGISTFNGSNSPLILVDGIESTGGFAQIDPSEIASISVLKDAASTAIYGVRGANGVILITTRRGENGRPSVTVSGNVVAKSVASTPDQLGSYDVLMLGQDAYKNNADYGNVRSQAYIDKFLDPNRDMYKYPDIDWYDELLKKIGWEESVRVNISGGSDFVKYFSSISFVNQGDVLENESVDGYYDPRFSYNKLNFRTNLDFSLTNTTQFRVDVAGRKEIRKTPSAAVDATQFSNVFKFIDEATPYLFPKYYPEEFISANADPYSPYKGGVRLVDVMRSDPYQDNPWNALNQNGMRKYTKDVVDITLGLNQDLEGLVKGLKASFKYNYSSYSSYYKREDWPQDRFWYDAENEKWTIQGTKKDQSYERTSYSFHPKDNGYGYSSSNKSIYYEGKLSYNRVFAEKHNINAVAVFNRSERETSLLKSKRLREEWGGQVNYDFDKRYYINATAGYTGSDKFGLGYRFGFFPSAALGWNIANESFFKNAFGKTVSQVKLRYSIGKTGSDAGGSEYMYMGGWSSLSARYVGYRFGFPYEKPVERWAETKLANPDASWEDSYKQNIGIDIAAFNEDLKFSIDAFNERREGIFISIPTVSYFHPEFGSGINDPNGEDSPNIKPEAINLGKVKNHGFEIEASYGYTLPNDLRLTTGVNFTAVENRVIYRADPEYKADYQKNAGKPLGWTSGYITDGYVNDFEHAINSPDCSDFGGIQAGDYAFVDYNGDGRMDYLDAAPLEGTKQPLFIYGFRFGASYKGFDITAKFLGKNDVYYAATNYYPNFNQFLLEAKTAHADVWTPANPNAAFPSYRASGVRKYEKRSTSNLMDASYLKLNNVTISYRLKSNFLSRTMHINNVTLGLTGHNLYTWTKVPFGDPEGGNSISGSYGGNYPLVRRFIFDIKLNF